MTKNWMRTTSATLLSLLSLAASATTGTTTFEANRGQTSPEVRYLARAPEGHIRVGTHGWSVIANDRATHFHFANAREPRLEAREPRDSRSNYFLGQDPSRWLRDVPHYDALVYRNVYAGVDAVLHHRRGTFEYDFLIASGVDPRVIAVEVTGAQPVLRSDGSLSFDSGLVQKKPIAFQEIAGQRRPVDVTYSLAGNRIQFALGAYDADHPLIIDPEIQLSTFFGGTNDDVAYAVATGQDGSVYIGGATYSLDLPTKNPYQSTNRSAPTTEDAFLAKFTATGQLVYATYIGSDVGYDEITAIAIGAQGHAFVGGQTHSRNFPTTPGAFQPRGTPTVGADGFLTKFSPSGNTLVFSTYLAAASETASSIERMKAVVPRPNGDVYFLLSSEHPSFPMTPGAFISNGCKSTSTVVGKINSTGTALLASTYVCGGRSDVAESMVLDQAGNVYIAGDFSSNPFPFNYAEKIAPRFAYRDGFVAKLNGELTSMLSLVQLGGDSGEWLSSIVIDDDDVLWVGGKTSSDDFEPLVSPTQPTYAGPKGTNSPCMFRNHPKSDVICGDAILVKLDTSLKVLFSTYLGGNGDDEITGLAMGSGGRVYASGTTSSPNFPSVNAQWGSFHGAWDAFVGSFLPSGKTEYLATIGGTAREEGIAIATGPGALWMTGWTASQLFPTKNAFKGTLGNLDEDAFLFKLDIPRELSKRRATR